MKLVAPKPFKYPGLMPNSEKLLWPLLLSILALSFPALLAAETLYVKSDRTKVFTEESARSKLVGKLKKGARVKVVEKSKRFYKVGLPGGSEGWVFKFKLTSKAPESLGGGGDGGLLAALGGEQKISAREESSGGSIRGLSPTSQKFGKSKGIPQSIIDTVISMENYRVSGKELDQFQSQGRLGEYAN